MHTDMFEDPNSQVGFKKDGTKTGFIELDVEWGWNEEGIKFIKKQGVTPINIQPVITIEKIIVGYRNKNNNGDLADVFYSLNKEYSTKAILEDSTLSKYF